MKAFENHKKKERNMVVFILLKLTEWEDLKAKELLTKMTILELDLRGYNWNMFPKEIINLTSLQKLDLRDNKLTKLPKEIGNLTSL